MKITTHIDASAPAETSWDFIGGQFGNIGDWITLLQTSHLDGALEVGATRTCILNNGKESEEELTHFDPSNHSYTYVATKGIPPMFKLGKNNWSVKSVGTTGSRITSEAEVQLRWWAIFLTPIVWLGLKYTLGKVRKHLKFAIEYGRPHPDVVSQKIKIGRGNAQHHPGNA